MRIEEELKESDWTKSAWIWFHTFLNNSNYILVNKYLDIFKYNIK